MPIPKYNLELITPPTQEPVSIRLIKQQSYINTEIEEEYLQLLITTARMQLEDYAEMAFLTQTWRLWWHEPTIPYSDYYLRDRNPLYYSHDFYLPIPLFPLQSVTSIVSYTRDNEAETIAASRYFVQTTAGRRAREGRVLFDTISQVFNNLRILNSLSIDFVAGFASPSAVPEPIKLAIMQQVAFLYENRQDVGNKTISETAIRLLAPYIKFTF